MVHEHPDSDVELALVYQERPFDVLLQNKRLKLHLLDAASYHRVEGRHKRLAFIYKLLRLLQRRVLLQLGCILIAVLLNELLHFLHTFYDVDALPTVEARRLQYPNVAPYKVACWHEECLLAAEPPP